MPGIHATELILLVLVAFMAILVALAERLKVPYPIMLVIGGLILSQIPIFPDISLNPAWIFIIVLPPLLYASALQTSWREFRANLFGILLLAFGLVAFTVAGVAIGSHLLLPGFTLATGAVLGAVVSTTDAISASAIGRRVGLPKEIIDLIESESLVNDAAGLVALQFSVALVSSQQVPTLFGGLSEFLLLVLGGGAAGLAVGWIVYQAQRPVEGSALQTLIGIATPYVAYLVGESIHASGVLAVVVCGLYIGRRSSQALTVEARVESGAVWNTIEFALNGFVFMLIGLQLPSVLPAMRPIEWPRLIAGSAFICILILGLRMIWVFPSERLSNFVRAKMTRHDSPPLDKRTTFIIGWSGMRGVLTLAAAFSLPTVTDTGAPFPHRPAILFLAFASILVSLTGQGLTLPYLIRKLGVSETPHQINEERTARRTLTSAALRMLENIRRDDPEESRVATDLLERFYRQRLEGLEEDEREEEDHGQRLRAFADVSGRLREVERAELLRLQEEGTIGGETLRKLERELDLLELRGRST